MNDEEVYQFHQTPPALARDLLRYVPLLPLDVVAEPFRGEGAFYDNFPDYVERKWAEITKGVDYTTLEDYDWVVTNPPFRLENERGKLVNSFWFLLDYYSTRARKGIAFLGNDSCFSTLTPKRQALLRERGWYITTIVVCSVKKWRGRYFFIVFQRIPTHFVEYLPTNY